jgi:type II secretory pathway pseudopilin PulG
MRKGDDDAGFTLIDTLMSTVVMTVVMAVFTTSILSMYRTAKNVDAKSMAQTQISIAMQRLDREVRYAVGISQPYNSGQYVDFLTVQQGKQECVQLRVAGGVLARRTWIYRQAPGSAGWTTLAGGVTAAAPFAYLAPTTALGFQQLTVTLQVGTGGGKDVNTGTFTAMNSSRTTGNDYCIAGR